MTTKSMKIANAITKATKMVSRIKSDTENYTFLIQDIPVAMAKSELNYTDACLIRRLAIAKLALKEFSYSPYLYDEAVSFMGARVYSQIFSKELLGLPTVYSIVADTLRTFFNSDTVF